MRPRPRPEPVGRNTAAAVAVAALMALEWDAKAILLVMPSDHLIADNAAFAAAVEEALPAARAGSLILFGIQPTRPETGYGYIRGGPLIAGQSAVRQAVAFVEIGRASC